VHGEVKALDTAGNVYGVEGGGVDTGGGCCVPVQVVKSAAGSNTPTVLPFTGLFNPDDVAVDNAGDVYVTDHPNDRVVKLAASSNNQTVLPFTGLDHPVGVAVDSAGNVYIVDAGNHRVLKLAAG
jgi:serine/threonine-protein kinase